MLLLLFLLLLILLLFVRGNKSLLTISSSSLPLSAFDDDSRCSKDCRRLRSGEFVADPGLDPGLDPGREPGREVDLGSMDLEFGRVSNPEAEEGRFLRVGELRLRRKAAVGLVYPGVCFSPLPLWRLEFRAKLRSSLRSSLRLYGLTKKTLLLLLSFPSSSSSSLLWCKGAEIESFAS